MNDRRLESVLRRYREEFQRFVVIARPYRCEEDESIRHFVNFLNVPSEQMHDVEWRAWDVAFEVFGDDPVPFVMTAISPESSAKYFAQYLPRRTRGSTARRQAKRYLVRESVAAGRMLEQLAFTWPGSALRRGAGHEATQTVEAARSPSARLLTPHPLGAAIVPTANPTYSVAA